MRARNINTCYVWPIDCGPAREFLSKFHAHVVQDAQGYKVVECVSPSFSPWNDVMRPKLTGMKSAKALLANISVSPFASCGKYPPFVRGIKDLSLCAFTTPPEVVICARIGLFYSKYPLCGNRASLPATMVQAVPQRDFVLLQVPIDVFLARYPLDCFDAQLLALVKIDQYFAIEFRFAIVVVAFCAAVGVRVGILCSIKMLLSLVNPMPNFLKIWIIGDPASYALATSTLIG